MKFQPRFIRANEAHLYLGMCRTVFAREIRPYLTTIKIGEHANARARAFDRLDLDAAADDYKRRMGCAPTKKKPEAPVWQTQPAGLSSAAARTTSTNNTSANAFEAAVKRVTTIKRLKSSR